VYVVLGPAGSGKSTVGKRIARRHRAAYLDKDGLVTGFTELLLETMGFARSDRDHNAYYLSTLMPLEYETLLRVCGDNLAVGSSVVLDAPFGRYFADENYLLDAAARHGWPDADLVVVHVSVDGPALLDRLVRRANPRDEWKIAHWQEFWPQARAQSCVWAGARHVNVDNTGDEPDLSVLDGCIGTTPSIRR
jgi:predicted kinase